MSEQTNQPQPSLPIELTKLTGEQLISYRRALSIELAKGTRNNNHPAIKPMMEVAKEADERLKRYDKFKEALEWYGGSRRPEDLFNDNGEKAAAALKG